MKLIYCFILVISTISCSDTSSEKTTFLVTKTSVGSLKKGMCVKDIFDIVSKDQIKKTIDYDDYENYYDDYQYFDEFKIHLLTLTPAIQNDINSKINRILILDKRYRTSKNIGLGSTYKDLKNNYTITSYNPDMEHIILTVSELNASFSIHKNQLLNNWWDDSKKQINSSKIPNSATFDTFVI